MPVFKESDADEYLHWATIMSSLAQEESCSISENITWGQRRSFAKGKVHMPYKLFLGYEKGEDGCPTIVEEEAAVVRLIYRLFLEGKTPSSIRTYLEDLGIRSPRVYLKTALRCAKCRKRRRSRRP